MGITDIEYNYLNLPNKFVQGTTELLYTYDAASRKLGKQFGGSYTHYVDGIQYKDGVLDFIQTEEGRILPNGSSYVYEYFLQDHLGNTRAVVDHTGALKQITDYYAFGMEMNRGNALNAASNQYKYSGKELQVELGLDQLDYGARFYDAEIGRWNVVDPLAEDYMHWSPYNYAMNSPLVYIDPDGMAAEGYFTRYIDPNGNTILNTDDGREDVVMVPWNRMEQFLENAYWTDKSPLTDIGSKGWNDHWRSEFGIHIKESTLNYAGHHFLETEAARAAQVKYLVTGKASDFRDFVNKRVSASWNFANVVTAISATGGMLSKSVQFGKVANQINHAERHLIKNGLDVQTVQNTIRKDLAPNVFYQTGTRIQGTVVVDNVVINYSGTKLPNGTINIGSIKPPR